MEKLIVELLALLVIKHFIVDFILQGEYQWRNKGTLGHPGGLLHSGLHAIGTGVSIWYVFDILPVWFIMGASVLDGFIHYMVDWAKMNINRIKGWKADTHPQFWYALGADQLAHYLTYVLILNFIVDFHKI